MPKALLILLIVLAAIVSNSKKKKQKRAPVQKTPQPAHDRPWPQEKAAEPVAPLAQAELDEADVPEEAEIPEEPEQPQVHVTLKTVEEERREPGLGQGESRECEHGVIGGSIAGDVHEGEEKHAVRRAPETQPVELDAPLRPRLNARELRRAVVMSEILKRPGERGRRF